MSERRGHWYLITGALIGIALGLVTSWGIVPVPHTAASPASLRADFKDEYRYMISAAYASAGNLGRARARLALLDDKDPIQALTDQSKRMLANNIAPNVVRNISNLSAALQAESPPTETPIPTELAFSTATESVPVVEPSTTVDNPTATNTTQVSTEAPTLEPAPTEAATPTPLPPAVPTDAPHSIHTATFTPGPPFKMVKSTTFCESSQPGLLQISLTDSNGQPAAGIELIITWAGGEEHFFSGLKPELGNGYADFIMSPNIDYALSVSNGATRVSNLKSTSCTTKDGDNSSGGIHLDFKQP